MSGWAARRSAAKSTIADYVATEQFAVNFGEREVDQQAA
jgi:hypothetical protein